MCLFQVDGDALNITEEGTEKQAELENISMEFFKSSVVP